MITFKKVIRFTLIFSVVYTILYLPVFRFREAYIFAVQSTGTKLFHHFGDKGIVYMKPKRNEKSVLNLFISREDRKTGTVYQGNIYDLNIDTFGLYLPLILFLSLVIATTISWKRRFFALSAGILFVLVYSMLKFRVMILYLYSKNPTYGLYQEAGEKESINFWHDHFANFESFDYTFVLILWIILCIGKKEWQSLSTVLSNEGLKRKTSLS